MPKGKKDPEIAALETVHAALKPLAPEVRIRVLASVRTLLEMPSPTAGQEKASLRSGAESMQRSLTTRSPGLTELRNEKGPRSNPQLIAFFAYYREKYENVPSFGRDDLLPYFAKAHEPPPRNYARDFADAVRRGWIHEDGDNSYITSKGIEVVESGFGRDSASAGRETGSRRPGKPRRR